jgi:uncharacterized membrane protein
MNPEVGKIVQQLADKLGVSVQYLWTVLVRGNRIEGAILTVFVFIGLAFLYTGFRLLKYNRAEECSYDDEFAYGLSGIISTLVGIGLFIGPLYWAIMDTFCPEYGALADILSHLGK